MNFLSFHRLAADRSDGLHPKLLALIEADGIRSNVVALAQRRGDPHIQAGPYPVGAAGLRLPDGVVRFAAQPAKPSPPGGSKASEPQKRKSPCT